MKLHFTYNLPDLTRALHIAEQTAEFADVLGIGSLLLFKEGVKAIQMFKAKFPNKELFVEALIVNKGPDAVTMMAQAGANYVSILAGTFGSTIKRSVATAKTFDTKVALDLLDAPSHGQSALDAKSLGVNLVILHRPYHNEESDLESEWHNVRENTNLPIFVTGNIDESNIQQVCLLKPQGIMIGDAVIRAENPTKTARLFRSLVC